MHDSEFLNMKHCTVYGKNSTDSSFIYGFRKFNFNDMSTHNYYVIFPAFLMQACLFFFASRLVYLLLRPLRQPIVVCNALIGILLGPSVLGRNQGMLRKLFPEDETLVVHTFAILGGVYFIFLEAVKIDKDRILRTVKYAWKVSVTCVVITFIVTFSLTRLVHKYFAVTFTEYFLLGLSIILSLNFLSVVSNAITELKLLNSELGCLAISCSMLCEITTWIVSAVPLRLIGTTTQKLLCELCVCAIILIVIFFIRPIVLWIIKNTPEGKPVKEIYIMGLLILPLVMGTLTDSLGVTFGLGAILVGLVIPPGPPLGLALVEKCQTIKSNLLLPFLYLWIGQLTNIYSIKDWKAFAALFLIMFGAVLGKMIACLLALLFFETSVQNAILLSLSLNVRGINDLLVAIRWRRKEVIDEATFTALIFCNMMLTAILTPLVNIYYKPHISIEGPTEDKPAVTLRKLPFNVGLRILCGIHYEENVHSIITLLKAFNPSNTSSICAFIIHLQELVGRTTPLLAPYNHKRKRLFPNSTHHIMHAVTKNLESSSAAVSLQPYTMISPYNTMHQSICKFAQDQSTTLILLPFHKSHGVHQRMADLRDLNNKILENSPCPVGIFVDRGIPFYLNTTRLAYSVMVLFLGGPDDREALSLVLHMSDHPDVRITVFRILFDEEYDKLENEREKKLDDYVINRFLSKTRSSPCVTFDEVLVSTTMQMIETIRSTEEDNYDLMIVGKRRVAGSQLEQEMKPWVEHKELGEIGDYLASDDFCQGIMFVLVIQCVVSTNITEKN
ncbi:hypothetical protein Pint_06589 [Pistacia integerrima]|uniref:Uncharacterized protein n=1 Tax=Pistacia integerrima TaxID=434235 RepID=A0ACC0Z216_9ROSI|nr:hypothetical protein Pint_06589 [Pistacia integerrima]